MTRGRQRMTRGGLRMTRRGLRMTRRGLRITHGGQQTGVGQKTKFICQNGRSMLTFLSGHRHCRSPEYQPGAIAQLGERLHGMQEVARSNRVGSILRRSHSVSYAECPAKL